MEAIEKTIQQGLYQRDKEKTYIDKLLARTDIEAIRDIVKKPILAREDILELLYLLTSAESKLHNFSEWDRHVVLKFFVWIREFVKMLEILYDYEDMLKVKKIKLSENGKQLLDNARMKLQHNAKFLVDLYLNICRTSQSVGGTGFLELLKNKFEMMYPNLPAAQTEPKKSIWGIKK